MKGEEKTREERGEGKGRKAKGGDGEKNGGVIRPNLDQGPMCDKAGSANERAYATSYWSSIVTLVLYCPVSEIMQVFC